MNQKLLVLVALILTGCGGASSTTDPQAAFTPRVTYYAPAPIATPEPSFVVRFAATQTPTPTLTPKPATPKPQPTPINTLSPAAISGIKTIIDYLGLSEPYGKEREMQTALADEKDVLPSIISVFGYPENVREFPATIEGIELIARSLEYSPENITVLLTHRASDKPPYKWVLVGYMRTNSLTRMTISTVYQDMAVRIYRNRP